MLLDLIKGMGCGRSIDFLGDDSEDDDWYEEKEDDGVCDFYFSWMNDYYRVHALRDVKEWSDTQISNGYLGDQTA